MAPYTVLSPPSDRRAPYGTNAPDDRSRADGAKTSDDRMAPYGAITPDDRMTVAHQTVPAPQTSKRRYGRQEPSKVMKPDHFRTECPRIEIGQKIIIKPFPSLAKWSLTHSWTYPNVGSSVSHRYRAGAMSSIRASSRQCSHDTLRDIHLRTELLLSLWCKWSPTRAPQCPVFPP